MYYKKKLTIKSLVWDDFNLEHIKKHAVSKDEVEEACQKILFFDTGYDKRIVVTGKTHEGRLISCILASKGKGGFYPVTARDASRKERRTLAHAKKNKNNTKI